MQTFSSSQARIAFIDVPPTGPDRGEPILLIHGFASTHAINWLHPQWVKTLTGAGRRVIALDNRGHGASEKFYDPAVYDTRLMAADALALLDHLRILRADVMGYSMGARITAMLALTAPARLRAIVLGGLGYHLVDGVGLPIKIADAMEAPSLDSLTDPMQRMFRAFADSTKSDRAALAACIRGSRQVLTPDEVRSIDLPALVAIGTKDPIAGDAGALAKLFPQGQKLDIPDRDHNLAVGDKHFKGGVLAFLEARD